MTITLPPNETISLSSFFLLPIGHGKTNELSSQPDSNLLANPSGPSHSKRQDFSYSVTRRIVLGFPSVALQHLNKMGKGFPKSGKTFPNYFLDSNMI